MAEGGKMEFKIVPSSESAMPGGNKFPQAFEIHDENGERVMVCHTQDEANAELNRLQMLCDFMPPG